MAAAVMTPLSAETLKPTTEAQAGPSSLALSLTRAKKGLKSRYRPSPPVVDPVPVGVDPSYPGERLASGPTLDRLALLRR